jgi:hypothetical protein
MVDWLIGWFVAWLIGWLIDCLADCFVGNGLLGLLAVWHFSCKETDQAIFLNHNSFAALRIEHMQSLFSS